MKKITLIAMLFAFASIAHAQTLTITAVSPATQQSPSVFFKSSARLLAVMNGEARADSTQKQDSTLSIIVFSKGVKAEVSKEEYNRILDLYASKHQTVSCSTCRTVDFNDIVERQNQATIDKYKNNYGPKVNRSPW